MKKIKQLRLSPDQLLTAEEQNAIVAGERRVYLGTSEHCSCTHVGNTHDRLITYRIEPTTQNYMNGVADIATGIASFYAGVTTSYAGIGLIEVGLGAYQIFSGISQFNTHYEYTRETFKCTSVRNRIPTGHRLISSVTTIQ